MYIYIYIYVTLNPLVPSDKLQILWYFNLSQLNSEVFKCYFNMGIRTKKDVWETKNARKLSYE